MQSFVRSSREQSLRKPEELAHAAARHSQELEASHRQRRSDENSCIIGDLKEARAALRAERSARTHAESQVREFQRELRAFFLGEAVAYTDSFAPFLKQLEVSDAEIVRNEACRSQHLMRVSQIKVWKLYRLECTECSNMLLFMSFLRCLRLITLLAFLFFEEARKHRFAVEDKEAEASRWQARDIGST
eukprot:Skav224558  [mRNA]  locus=scaffold2085:102726:106617:+ [translate_table: standard]